MRVIVLTCSRRGTASRILPALCAAPQLEVVRLVLAHGVSPNARKRRWRRFVKILRIGPLGAINGIRMRAWYRDSSMQDVEDLCRTHAVPFFETPFINCNETIHLFRDADADLVLSLGNGYIGERVFSIPRHGMVNLHSEVLPAFQGASAVIWPIHENVPETGFTIHQVNRKIDDGDILLQERWPIAFHDSLRETVAASLVTERERSTAAMVKVCTNYSRLKRNAVKQTGGRSYTTPTFWQFLRMVRNHARMRKRSMTKTH